MTILNQDGWRLKSIRVEFQEWGEYKGKYIGKMEFANKQSEAFSFNIPENKAHELLALIRDNVVDSAHNMGQRLVQSLGELPSAPENKQIEDVIPLT